MEHEPSKFETITLAEAQVNAITFMLGQFAAMKDMQGGMVEHEKFAIDSWLMAVGAKPIWHSPETGPG